MTEFSSLNISQASVIKRTEIIVIKRPNGFYFLHPHVMKVLQNLIQRIPSHCVGKTQY